MESSEKPAAYPVVTIGLICAVLIAAGHLWGVTSGLFLDDHAHYKHLKEGGWSYGWAVKASRLGVVGDVLDMWANRESGLLFYRPVTFWLMKLGYTVVGWRPTGMHVMSLLWHWVAAMLVARVAYGFLGRAVWAAVAGGAFAVHVQNVVTVYWIASQSELFVTIWLLAATLAYAKYSGWRTPWLDSDTPADTRPRWAYLALACVLYAGGLGCRENAIMLLPALIVADAAFGLRLRRWRGYLVLGGVAAAYLLLRTSALGGVQLPDRPYLTRPWDPDFVPFLMSKFAHYCLALFAYVPIIPVGGQAYFEARMVKFVLSFAGVVVGWILLALLVRRWGLAFPFAWFVLMMLPTLPVFSSPHHLYLPSAGMTMILATALALGAGHLRRTGKPPARAREPITYAIVGLHAVGLTFGAWAAGWIYRSSTAIEDQFLDDVVTLGHARRPLEPGDHLFFINLPTMAYYVIPALEQRVGVRGLHGHVLTFSPSPLLMETPSVVRQIDAHSFSIAVEGDRYFSGTSGRVLSEMMGFKPPFHSGDEWDAGLYRVRIDEADDDGFTRLTVTFARPLADQRFHFFLTSRARMAYPLLFSESTRHEAGAGAMPCDGRRYQPAGSGLSGSMPSSLIASRTR